MRINKVLTPDGRKLMKQVGEMCLADLVTLANKRMADYTTVPDPLEVPRIKRVIEANSLGHHIPRAPLFYFNSTDDELNPISGADKLMRKYCRRGAPVTYLRLHGYSHVESLAPATDRLLHFLDRRMAGEPVHRTC